MITVDIVTPSRRLVDGAKVAVLKVPSAQGEMTILPGHADMISLMGTGTLAFQQDGGGRQFAVSFGFLEVRKDKVVIMAETCEESSEIDKGRAATAQKKAEEKLAHTLSEEDFNKYQLKLQRAIVRQHVAS